jgi:hypothetical protein
MQSQCFQFSSSLKDLTLLVVIYLHLEKKKKQKKTKEEISDLTLHEASKLSTSDWFDPSQLLCYTFRRAAQQQPPVGSHFGEDPQAHQIKELFANPIPLELLVKECLFV